MLIKIDDSLVRSAVGSRARESHKGDYGYVGLVGGSTEYSGAIKLSNMAASAMRAGAGVTKLMVAEGLVPSVLPYLLESTLFPLPDDGCGAIRYDGERLDAGLKGLAAVGVGMGMGTHKDNWAIIEHILNKRGLKVVLDADGLNTVAREGVELLLEAAAEVAITPHLGEFSRLTGRTVEEIAVAPREYAEEFAARYGVTVLLKGATTYVTDGERTYINERGTPGMATAGSGDVLAGVLTAMAGYIPDITTAAAAAAYVNGAAGELAAKAEGVVGMVASDTARNISAALRQIFDE